MAAIPMTTTGDIPIKYINNTDTTDSSVVVFTKNFFHDAPETYVAWEVICVQTSSEFVYPITTSVGASYQLGDQHNTMGPFGAELGSTWEINQDDQATAPLLKPGLYACSVIDRRMCHWYGTCILDSCTHTCSSNCKFLIRLALCVGGTKVPTGQYMPWSFEYAHIALRLGQYI